MIAVYQRCLANYQSRQWDMGAHALFDVSLHKNIQATIPAPECYPLPPELGYACLSDCILAAQRDGASNAVCLKHWLMKNNVNSLDHFEYEVVQGNAMVHACQVFSGPAKIPDLVGRPFRICLEEYEDTGICKLPSIVWSGRSTNKVPIADTHANAIMDAGQKLQAAKTAYASIQRDVREAIEAMSTWNASKLNVAVFSAEGDMLHQFFDCYMMGAAGEVDMWPGPDVAKPIWSRNRDGGSSRAFELPCTGEALKDRQGKRDSKSPFTCGSYARRSVIKYFLRNQVQKDPSQNQNIIQNATQKLILDLKRAWLVDNLDLYLCQCEDGSHDPKCCQLDSSCDPSSTKCPCQDGSEPSYACCDTHCMESTFLPSRFQVEFTKLQGKDMLSDLFQQAANYLDSTVWLDNRPWLTYDIGGAEAYNWTNDELQVPLEQGMFDSTIPIQKYDHTELGYPYRSTVWEMCHGLLQQILFTMPLKNGAPTTLSEEFDPDTVSKSVNMTYREEFVQKLVRDAYKVSPLFWHYVVRHKPSSSAMCIRSKPIQPLTSNKSFFMQGFNSLKIGGYHADCFCGWWFNSTHCQLPEAVCERMILLIGSEEVQNVCNTGGICQNQVIEMWMQELVKLENGWRGWPCPSMSVSDHWGIIPDQTAWLNGRATTTQTYEFIMRNGTSGLRVGSLEWIQSNIIKHINPAQRRESIQPLMCDIQPSQTLVDHFVDDLFPAAQGVRHSAAVGACLRFTIELARLSAYQEAGLVVAAADQTSVVGSWRQRCEMKLKQVTFCQVYGVYNIRQVSAKCPFTISAAFDDYTLTSNCLVIYNEKIYDPCLCNVKWCSLTTDKLNLFDLNEECSLFHVRDMVLDRATGVPPWPSASETTVPNTLARSLFKTKILDDVGNVANNYGHWSTAEGSSFRYCDVVVDWWPDNWKHPVGYHVTLPCTDAAHRTFDAAWAALRIGNQVKMMYRPNTLRNRTLQTNAYGAAGVCRTHNYGMPMKLINTMRFCTQTDNRAVDPSVPGTMSNISDWGPEYCTQSPFDVPWSNGPSSIGTFFNYLVDILPFTGWGDDAGHAPFVACKVNSDCCSTCTCLMSKNGGVCAILQNGTFECAQHQHCTEKMCAGDGKCVQPVLELHNNASFDIVARMFTDQCKHSSTSTWGTSKEDVVPDILESSGMCSYRSWFEQRNLKNCSASECFVDGAQPWMFSSPKQIPKGAYDADVLKVKAHPCDRNYEHLAGLVSCNPGSTNTLLRDAMGQKKSYLQGKLTQTYRTKRYLPVVKHPWSNTALGFLGLPKLYSELGYGNMNSAPATSNSLVRPCSNFGLCAIQASAGLWFVNGKRESVRYVTVGSGTSAVQRSYTLDDQMSCGSMGYVDGTSCRIDAAVAPLFYVYCMEPTHSSVCSIYMNGLYPRSNTLTQLKTVANNLNTLFQLMQDSPINTWSQYLAAVDSALNIWDIIANQAWLSRFAFARVDQRYDGMAPKGLYFFFSYSAYEVPFAWWWRCSWLSGLPVSENPTSCDAWDGLSWEEGTGDIVMQLKATSMREISSKLWLARANGIFQSSTLQEARNDIHQQLLTIVSQLQIPTIFFACFNEGKFYRNFSDASYDVQVMNTVTTGSAWPTSKRFEQCNGVENCIQHTKFIIDASKNLVEDVKRMLITSKPCSSSCDCTSNLGTQQCSFGQDDSTLKLPLSNLRIAQDKNTFTVFEVVPGNIPTFTTQYDAKVDGCNVIHCCSGQLGCSVNNQRFTQDCNCFRDSPTEQEILSVGLDPKPLEPPWLIFSDSLTKPVVTGDNYFVKGSTYAALDVCKSSGKNGRCTFGDAAAQDSCIPKTNNMAKLIQDQYCFDGMFERTDSVDEVCAFKIKDTQNDCLDISAIANRYVLKPTGLSISFNAFSVPDKQCWILSCSSGSAWSQYNGQITYDPTGFDDLYDMELHVTQIEFDYSYGKMEFTVGGKAWGICADPLGGCYLRNYYQNNVRKLHVDVYMGSRGTSLNKVMSFQTRFCDKSQRATSDSQFCFQNVKFTRALSKEYLKVSELGFTRYDASQFTFLSDAQIHAMVINLVESTEDYYSEMSYSALCTERIINSDKTKFCIHNGSSIESTDFGTPDSMWYWWKTYVSYICSNNSASEWYINQFCPYNFKCMYECCNKINDNRFGIPANKMCPAQIADDVDRLAWSNFKQYHVVYKGSVTDKCGRTSTLCPYDEVASTRMTDAGLPISGFCPDCTTNFGCTSTKSSKTYAMMKSNINIHDIIPTTITTTKIPRSIKYYGMKLQPLISVDVQPQCNLKQCPSNKHLVEIYKGMSVCIPCTLIPSKYCSGQHMCSFLKWDWPTAPIKTNMNIFERDGNQFESVYDTVKANILAMLPSKVHMHPKWHTFLQSFNFTRYNPLELKQSFNDNIESLGTYCASNNNLPVFTDCQNDLPRRTLKNFSMSTYKIDDGNFIPVGHTLTWFSSKSQFLSTNIAAWHIADRNTYFEQLFNDNICKSGNIVNLICYKDTTTTPPTTLTVNPVLSGRFEIQEGCDVIEEESQRLIDSVCNSQTCLPTSDQFYDRYNTFEGNIFNDLSKQMRCKMKNGASAGFLSTPQSFPTNLCSKKPSFASRCHLQQGMVGQESWDGIPVDTVYTDMNWPGVFMPSGLLSGNNMFLNKKKNIPNVISNLTADPWDIGGHYIRMRMDQNLIVAELPLQSYVSLAGAAALPSTVDWLGNWRRTAVADGIMLNQYYVLRTCRSWDCPLRRRFFWSGAGSLFRPYVPNPLRTQVLYETYVHPTTKPKPVPKSAFIPYQTRNGFCLCLLGNYCLPADGPCSLTDTIASLTDLKYRTASVLHSDCNQQIDWPWTGGTMRDESVLPERVTSCGLLNRLPPFQYRYHNSKQILDTDKTTLDEGGDCHMGRAALFVDDTENCTLIEKYDTHLIVSCGSQNVTLQRPKSATINLIRRRRCEECDPLPSYHAADGTRLEDSEVSYGQLWRWSPARKLAQDLRFRLCGNDTICPQLDSSKLSLSMFWSHMMTGGLTGKPTDTVNQLFEKASEDPDNWTSSPWMLCTSHEDNTNCQGSASKRQWLLDRSGTCSAIKDLPNANDAVADLTICDLDESLDNLCRVIQNARYRLFETNCQLSGKCRTSSFFYQPATYSATNDQLSRQTIQYFYDFLVKGSCPVMSEELHALLSQNKITAEECSAQSLQMFQEAINAARQVLHFLVKIMYYISEIGTNLISLILTTDPNPIIKMVLGNFQMLLNEFKQFFMTLGDTLYKMIMETGQLGKFIRNMILAICNFLKWLIDSVVKPLTCFIKEFTIKIIDFFENFLLDGLGFMIPNETKNSLREKFGKYRNIIENVLNCEFENPFQCDQLFPDDDKRPSHLPMPTRCWVGYKPLIGDQKGLGCSASDTCMDDDGSFVACASCSGGTDMDRYGCDALTKLCRCHTFPVSQTQCSTHQECYLPDMECGFVDVYLQPSFGNVPCSKCTQKPVCLVTGQIGHCTCMLRSTSLQTCSTHAQRVSPDPTQLCLVSLGIAASSSSSYSANYRDLASTACANLNGAQTWCLNVWLDQGGNAFLTVGLAMLRGRRLLSLSISSNISIWSLAYEPCRSLMSATSLSVLEIYVASDCERWRQIGERTIILYNLTNVSDVQFSSYIGLAEANLPLHAYMSIVQYTDWFQPVLLVFKRISLQLRPVINMGVNLFESVERLSPIKENVVVIQELLPWFTVSSRKKENNLTFIRNESHYTRRLMGWKENLQSVKQFSVELANGNVANLNANLAGEWQKGPFVWPPNFNYLDTKHTCLAGELAYNFSYRILKSTVQYYTNTGPPRPVIDRSFKGALPTFTQWKGPSSKNEPILVTVFKEKMNSWFAWDFSSIKSYTSSQNGGLSQFGEDLADFVRCDFDKVQHCTAHRRSLLWGGIVVAFAFVGVSFFFKLLNIPMIDALLMLAYVPSVFFYVFNFSVMCSPMLPTCLMGEVVDLIQTVFPVAFHWPSQLQHWGECVNGAPRPQGAINALPGSAQCFRECTEAPFNYQTWEDNVAWLQCEIGYCDASFVRDYYQPLAATFPIPNPLYDFVQLQRYTRAIDTKRNYLDMEEQRQAQRVCCLFTIFNVVPVALGAVGLAILALAAAALMVSLIQSVIAMAIALIAFAHSW